MTLTTHTDFPKTDQSSMSTGALPFYSASLFKPRPCCLSPFTRTVNISATPKVWDRRALGTGQQRHAQIVGLSKSGSGGRAQILVAWHEHIQKYEKCTRNPWHTHTSITEWDATTFFLATWWRYIQAQIADRAMEKENSSWVRCQLY